MQRDAFAQSNLFEQLRFAFRINNFTLDCPGHNAIDNLQAVGEYVVNAEFRLQALAHVLKTTREDGRLVAKMFERTNQAMRTVVEAYRFCNLSECVITLGTMWGLELPLAWYLTRSAEMGQLGVAWAMLVAMVVRPLIYVPYFYWGRWMRVRVFDEPEPHEE